MNRLTTILVEDNSLALEMLESDISNYHKEIEIIGTAKSVVQAAKLLRKTRPDILFLDIMLGDGTGFDILEIFPDLQSKIIFVSPSFNSFQKDSLPPALTPRSMDSLLSILPNVFILVNFKLGRTYMNLTWS